jgi:Bacterial pre-peptidase C-terminal domain
MPKDLAGNNFLNARTIAAGSSIKDFVNKSDRVDVYKVSLGQRSSFALSVGNLKSNVSVSLYGSNGQLIQSSNQKKNKPEQISSTLEAGAYYISVNLFRRGKTPYVLQTTATPSIAIAPTPSPSTAPIPSPTPAPPPNPLISPSPEPGQSLRSAYDMGVLTGVKGFQEYVGTYDSLDYYKFTLADPTPFSAIAVSATSGIGIELIQDVNGNGWYDGNDRLTNDPYYSFNSSSSYEGPQTRTVTSKNLDRGTYFLKIINGRGTGYQTNYTLTVAPSSQVAPFPSPTPTPSYPVAQITSPALDPGSATTTAYDVGLLSGNKIYRDFVGSSVGIADGDDLYKFSLDQNAEVGAKLDSTKSGVGLQLFYDRNQNGKLEDSEELGRDPYYSFGYEGSYEGPQNRSLSLNLDRGTYFVRVTNGRIGYGTDYTLRLFT